MFYECHSEGTNVHGEDKTIEDIRFNTVESTGLESHQSVFPVVRNHAEVVDCTTQYLYLLVIQVEGTISCFQWHPSVHRATMQYLQS